jgi:hypothetical protein
MQRLVAAAQHAGVPAAPSLKTTVFEELGKTLL